MALSVWEATEFLSEGKIPQPLGSAHRMSAPYQALECEDGYITVGAANDRLFMRLSELLGHPEWVDETNFATDTARVANHTALAGLIQEVTKRKPKAYWLDLFNEHGIPGGPINSYEDTLTDGHIRAREMIVNTDHPTLGRLQTLGTPLKMSETPLVPGRPAPLLGEHTEEVLLEVGYQLEEIEKFRSKGVVN